MSKGYDKSEDIEDVNFEPEEELGDAAATQAKLKKLREELAAVKKERQEYLDGWQRCKADSVNARKDMLAAADRASERVKEAFLSDVIPALDSFDMATGNEAWEAMDAGWKSGIEHIRNQLLDVLERNDIKRFGKVGEKFDPQHHEAVQEVEDMPGEPHSIVKILRYGYEVGGRIIRPAQVIVKA
ncbi:nucleotide exchange factor GrpE [Candidatus Kaiserbacteria bacterium]|nr:nucleotide exchange factor GrpE [Candidatus Kaiserbacteria bacterium]